MQLYKFFISKRPESENHPGSRMYLTPKHGSIGKVWFKRQPMGKNTIGDICKKMASEGQIEGRKTNHSARKMTVQTLKENGFSDNDI